MCSRYGSEPLHDPEPYEVVEGDACSCGSVVIRVEGERVCARCWVVLGEPDESEVCDAAAE